MCKQSYLAEVNLCKYIMLIVDIFDNYALVRKIPFQMDSLCSKYLMERGNI